LRWIDKHNIACPRAEIGVGDLNNDSPNVDARVVPGRLLITVETSCGKVTTSDVEFLLD